MVRRVRRGLRACSSISRRPSAVPEMHGTRLTRGKAEVPKDFRPTTLERDIGRQLAGWRNERDGGVVLPNFSQGGLKGP